MGPILGGRRRVQCPVTLNLVISGFFLPSWAVGWAVRGPGHATPCDLSGTHAWPHLVFLTTLIKIDNCYPTSLRPEATSTAITQKSPAPASACSLQKLSCQCGASRFFLPQPHFPSPEAPLRRGSCSLPPGCQCLPPHCPRCPRVRCPSGHPWGPLAEAHGGPAPGHRQAQTRPDLSVGSLQTGCPSRSHPGLSPESRGPGLGPFTSLRHLLPPVRPPASVFAWVTQGEGVRG